MRRFIVTLALALLLAPLARAEAWRPCPGDETETTNVARVLSPGNSLCYRSNDGAATDPPRVDGAKCSNVTVLYDADVTGTDTDATVYVYRCASMAGTGTTDCEKILTDVDPDTDAAVDDVPLNGSVTGHRDVIAGVYPVPLAFDVTANADPDLYEIRLLCH